jgi:hypothetical protein
MPDKNAAVAVYATHDQAEAAVRRLQEAGIPMERVSLVGRGGRDGSRAVGQYTRGSEVRHVGEHRGLWGFLSGLLADTGTFVIPGAGPVMAAGPAVGWVAEALENAEGGDADAVSAGLTGAGIPPDDVQRYHTALQDGDVLLIVHSSPDEVKRAKSVLDNTGARESSVHTD